MAEEGKTPLYFAADGRMLGMIAVADVVKQDSAFLSTCLERRIAAGTSVSLDFISTTSAASSATSAPGMYFPETKSR